MFVFVWNCVDFTLDKTRLWENKCSRYVSLFLVTGNTNAQGTYLCFRSLETQMLKVRIFVSGHWKHKCSRYVSLFPVTGNKCSRYVSLFPVTEIQMFKIRIFVSGHWKHKCSGYVSLFLVTEMQMFKIRIFVSGHWKHKSSKYVSLFPAGVAASRPSEADECGDEDEQEVDDQEVSSCYMGNNWSRVLYVHAYGPIFSLTLVRQSKIPTINK